MDTSQYLDAVLENVTLLVGAASKAGLDAPVPTCPKWKVADLVIHQGRVLRWMGAIVGERSQENIHPGTLDQPEGQDPLYWLKSGAQRALQIQSAGSANIAEVKMRMLQKRNIERFWKKLADAVSCALAAQVDQGDFDIAAKLPQDLPARAVGRRQLVRVGRDLADVIVVFTNVVGHKSSPQGSA